MSNTGCGCGGNGTPSGDNEYIMVKATGTSPSTCGLPDIGASSTAACAKQEPEFDSILSEFVVPDTGSSVTIQVCNPSVYSVNQWIQFAGSELTMQIISITGNNLLIRNGCANGSEIIENPNAGLLIPRLTRFFTVGAPDCLTEEERLDEILAALNGATQICTPDLVESSAAAEIQPVGLVTADPSDTAFTKCIKRIRGILFKSGTPVLSQIQNVAEADTINYRKLGINKTNREVRELPDYGEYAGLTAGEQYQVGVKPSGAEYLMGPSYGFKPLNITLLENPSNPLATTGATSPASSTVLNQTFNLSTQPDISSVKRNQDHYWVLVQVEIGLIGSMGVVNSPGKVMSAKLNGSLACTTHGFNDSSTNVNSRNTVTIPVRVLNSDNNLTLLIEQNVASASTYVVRLYIRGVWF